MTSQNEVVETEEQYDRRTRLACERSDDWNEGAYRLRHRRGTDA